MNFVMELLLLTVIWESRKKNIICVLILQLSFIIDVSIVLPTMHPNG